MSMIQRKRRRDVTTARRYPGIPLPVADIMIAAILLIVFVAAFLQSQQWGFRTALFPRVVTVAGCVVTVLFLLTVILSWWRGRGSRPDAVDDAANVAARRPEGELVDEEDEHDHEVEYVFATAGRVAWASAIGWIALFVTVLYVGGLFVASAVFCIAYLRWGARRTWRFAVLYAAVITGILYLALHVLLIVPVPEGMFM